jgi:hypothetical protein
MKAEPKTLSERLSGFLRWFFNASPVWVDERSLLRDTPSGEERRDSSGHADRRRGDARSADFHRGSRRDPS